tara:strand:+ start:344 stop:1099 length:756 start_codon:yes stop_codon:yes gene_type:complete
MHKIYIFDVDGTLTPSRQKMTKEFKEFFETWAEKNTFYLVTGSDLPKLQEQMDYLDVLAQGIFTCCGNQYWEPDPHTVNTGANIIYSNEFKPPQTLLTYLGEQLRFSKYFARCGNHIEDRGSMLNFSIVGRDCTLLERENYFEWDNKFNERKTIAKYIREQWRDLDAVIGGQISIDIYPKGKDKSQILDHIKQDFAIPFMEAPKYIFIGDRTMEGGNDYPLARLMDEKNDCEWYQTEGWEQTQKILKELND